MTDVCYVAVKGSLHASDSSVFGLNNEEIAALSKRYHDTKKEVINGVLIKANPLQIINSLSELGYRVACSSGEAEIVWTLRREVLDKRGQRPSVQTKVPVRSPEKFALPSLGGLSETDLAEENRFGRRPEPRPIIRSPPTKKPVKPAPRIGTDPQDVKEYLGRTGSRIIVTSPEEVENIPEDQKIIIKTNELSEDNPMLWEGNERAVGFTFVERDQICDENDMSCARAPPVPSVHQTLEEMDFERGLWYPALTGDLPRVRTLLGKGHNPNSEDKNGYTALHYAARSGFSNICIQLLEAGAQVNKATRAGGATPLHRAALAGNDDTVTVLIKYGGNLLSKDADGRIPLHRAVEGNNPTTVSLLLEALPESSVVKDRSGKTARHYVKPNNKVMIKLFDVDQPSRPTLRNSAPPTTSPKARTSPRKGSP